MKSFIDDIASYIKNGHQLSCEKLTVVLPSQRAGLFLKRSLAKTYGKSIKAPKILTIDDWLKSISKYDSLSSIEQFFQLYSCYTELQNEQQLATDSIDEFYNWAPQLFGDFNEIDQYLVNGYELFAYMNDVRAMETWNVDGSPLNEYQLKYIALWKSIGKLYHRFSKWQKENKKAYGGHIIRYCAENIESLFAPFNEQEFLFAGFNALSTAEERIIKYVVKNSHSHILWDSDQYYMEDKVQEAGLFFRKVKSEWSNIPFNWVNDHLSKGEKTINVYTCNSKYAQSILCSSILNTSETAHLQTAVVLNEEDLLLPLLNALPDKVDAANITMGYEVRNAPLSQFIDLCIALWQQGNDNKKNAYYHKTLLQLLNNSYFHLLCDDKVLIEQVKQIIVKKNMVYCSQSFIAKLFAKQSKVCDQLFWSEPASTLLVVEKILTLLGALKDVVTGSKLAPLDKSLHFEYLFHFTKVYRKLQLLSEEFDTFSKCELKLFKKLVTTLINREKIAFYGEPLQGIQIMGMLETRALDFEHVIITSVNEGVLPSGKRNHSFIPHDLKKEFQLPTHLNYDAVYANHFYRLIQRAKRVDLVYYESPDDFGSGTEKSRFLEQLKHELPVKAPKVKLQNFEYNPRVSVDDSIRQFKMNNFIRSQYLVRLERGLSASGINNLISCNMDFYFKYVMGFGEQDEVEEDIQASTFGTCVHNTLEKVQENNIGQLLNKADVKRMKKDALPVLHNEFLQHFSKADISSGANLLSYEVAKSYVGLYFDHLISIIDKKQEFWIKELEMELKVPLSIFFSEELKQLSDNSVDFSKELNINFNGKIDCIAEIAGQTCIIDYKTGKVSANDINIKGNVEELLKGKKSKAIQLLAYLWMFYQKHPETDNIKACIYSFKNNKEGLIPLLINKRPVSKKQVLELFPALVQELIENNLLVNSIVHNVKSLYCEYCR